MTSQHTEREGTEREGTGRDERGWDGKGTERDEGRDERGLLEADGGAVLRALVGGLDEPLAVCLRFSTQWAYIIVNRKSLR